ncbi:MAG: lamin tail domain-containing protein, partial [Candidatus Paceibacteria bacterium]
LSDYWSILSKQAVLNGAGVVKLFFDEVEKERETKTLAMKNRSWFQRIYDATAGNIFNTSKALYGSSVTYEDLQGAVVQSQKESEPEVVEEAIVEEVQEGVIVEPEMVEVVVEEEPAPEGTSGAGGGVDIQEIIEEVTENTESPDAQDDNHKYYYEDSLIEVDTPFYGGGGGGVRTQETASTPDPTPPDSPIITSPTATYFATTTITFSGIASSTLVISSDYSSATTTASGDENWSLTLTDFTEGTTTIQFTATDSDSLDSDTTEISVIVDLTAPSFSSFSILQCDYSLRSDGNCLSGSDTLNLSWSSTSTDISYYSITKDGGSVATTTDTSSSQTLTNGASYSMEVVAYDEAGNVATSTSQSVEIFTMPVVINEVAWSGTASSTADEWIELYNRTSYTIDLSNVDLVADDGVPYLNLSGSIATSSYYLIERGTDGDATSVSQDLAVSFSFGLSNDVEQLSLIHSSGGQASTTLDSTPTTSSCSGSWCAGTASSDYRSMERISVSTAGTDTSNWSSNNTYTKNGTDIGGNAINGTPRSQNSVSLQSIGYYCPDETASYVSGGYYTPASSSCTYLSPTLSGNRYGDIYRGTIASSTIVMGHSLSSNATSTQTDTLSSPVQGEDYFVAIFVLRVGVDYANDLTNFRDYFKTGANAPPHLDYGVLEWKYGVEP